MRTLQAKSPRTAAPGVSAQSGESGSHNLGLESEGYTGERSDNTMTDITIKLCNSVSHFDVPNGVDQKKRGVYTGRQRTANISDGKLSCPICYLSLLSSSPSPGALTSANHTLCSRRRAVVVLFQQSLATRHPPLHDRTACWTAVKILNRF